MLYRRFENACNHTDLLVCETTLGPVSILHESGQELLEIVFFKNETLEILFEFARPLHNGVMNLREQFHYDCGLSRLPRLEIARWHGSKIKPIRMSGIHYDYDAKTEVEHLCRSVNDTRMGVRLRVSRGVLDYGAVRHDIYVSITTREMRSSKAVEDGRNSED